VQDRKFICPCYRHPEDIARDGHCICHLFVDQTYEPPDPVDEPPQATFGARWPDISVYGAAWCRDTIRTRTFLNRNRVPYTVFDVDRDPEAAALVRQWNRGQLSTPTLVVDGRIVTEPSDDELAALLGI
jgi:glutaredoxin